MQNLIVVITTHDRYNLRDGYRTSVKLLRNFRIEKKDARHSTITS